MNDINSFSLIKQNNIYEKIEIEIKMNADRSKYDYLDIFSQILNEYG
jgi:hypothetical protein